MEADPQELAPLALFGYTYLSCAWVSFGLYAVSNTEWQWKAAFAATIHGANCGCITALLGARWIGWNRPWEIIGTAASTSMGWTSKKQIIELVTKVIAPKP